MQQKAVPEGVFGFKLTSNDSELFIGGTNPSKFVGEIEYHPLTSREFWAIGGANVSLDGRIVASGLDTIIDSGTTLMAAAPSVVNSFYANIEGSAFDAEFGFNTFPCDAPTPEVAFNWGGQTWSIDPSQ